MSDANHLVQTQERVNILWCYMLHVVRQKITLVFCSVSMLEGLEDKKNSVSDCVGRTGGYKKFCV